MRSVPDPLSHVEDLLRAYRYIYMWSTYLHSSCLWPRRYTHEECLSIVSVWELWHSLESVPTHKDTDTLHIPTAFYVAAVAMSLNELELWLTWQQLYTVYWAQFLARLDSGQATLLQFSSYGTEQKEVDKHLSTSIWGEPHTKSLCKKNANISNVSDHFQKWSDKVHHQFFVSFRARNIIIRSTCKVS